MENAEMALIERLKASPIIYQQERCITLALMDQIHERANGTAKRTFHRHRDKLAEGKHYFVVPYDVWSQWDNERTKFVLSFDGAGGYRGEIILLVERGYLVLVKSFQDPLAWKVQELLVESYFRLREVVNSPQMEALLSIVAKVADATQKNSETVAALCHRVARLECTNVQRLGDLVCLRQHIVKRWPDSREAQRRRITDLTVTRIRELGGVVHHQYGRILIDRGCLFLADEALDDVRAAAQLHLCGAERANRAEHGWP